MSLVPAAKLTTQYRSWPVQHLCKEVFWKVAQAASIVAYISLSAISITFAALSAPTRVPLLCSLSVIGGKAEKALRGYFEKWAQTHQERYAIETGVALELERIDQKKPQELEDAFYCLGATRAALPASQNGADCFVRLKPSLARYHYWSKQKDSLEDELSQLQLAESSINVDTDLKANRQKQFALIDQIILAKLKQAYAHCQIFDSAAPDLPELCEVHSLSFEDRCVAMVFHDHSHERGITLKNAARREISREEYLRTSVEDLSRRLRFYQ